MTEFWVTTLLSFLGGGLASQVFNWLTSRNTTTSQAWKEYAQKMEERQEALERKCDKLELENYGLRRRVNELEIKYGNG